MRGAATNVQCNGTHMVDSAQCEQNVRLMAQNTQHLLGHSD